MTLKPIGSSITIKPEAHYSQTSTVATETGARYQLTTAQRQTAVNHLLAINDPLEADKRLLSSLASMKGCKIKERMKTKYTSHGAEFFCDGFDIDITDEAQRKRAIEMTLSALEPMPVDDIKQQLSMMTALLVKPSGEGEQDVLFRINALAHQLAVFPADIVSIAIKRVCETSAFWPSYSEFYQHIGWRIKRRERLLADLQGKRSYD